MRSLFPPTLCLIAFLIPQSAFSAAPAKDATVDELLKKLPPPEKLVKDPVQRAARQEDPALKDRLGGEVIAAIESGNESGAINLGHKLIERYPQSAASHCLYGAVLMVCRKFPGAEAEFQQAVKL